jgi:hypothetical protein
MASRDKATKFTELANKRVNRAIKDLRLIGNLANRGNYQFTEEQAKKIIKILQKEVNSIKRSFKDSGGQNHDIFEL